MELDIIKGKKVAELREIAAALKIPGASAMKKAEIIALLTKMHEEAEAQETSSQQEKPSEVPAAAENKEAEAPAEKKPAAKRRGRPKKTAVAETEAVKEEAAEYKASEEQSGGEQLSLEIKQEEKPKKPGRRKKAKPAEEPEKSESAEIEQPKAEKAVEEQPADNDPVEEHTAASEDVPVKAASGTKEETAGSSEPSAAESKNAQKKRGRKKKFSDEKLTEVVERTGMDAPQTAEAALPQAAASEPGRPSEAVQPAGEEKPAEPAQKPEYSDPNRYETTGILDLAEGGFGFLRFNNFLTSDDDVYVSPTQIRRFNLKTGDEICGIVRRPGDNERFGALLFVKTVNGDEPGVAKRRRDFSSLTPIYPERRITLEKGSRALSMRLTDLIAPIGFGQRGLIVAPPKAGKTTLLKQIAQAIEAQPDIDAELIVLLIDERPEEVTDMQRSIKGHVIYSTFDEQPSHHVKVAEMVLARAQRLVEHKKNVIILLDSITRLARAYNLVEPPSGRTLSGGLDPAALYKPKKFFGAARNIEEGGSITILATALVETGSRMDDMIFEEFKGTGNMELHLDRNLQEKRIFPAINLNKSGTRREDMLMTPQELEGVWMMRRALADWGTEEATERIVLEIAQTRSNELFLERFRKVRL